MSNIQNDIILEDREDMEDRNDNSGLFENMLDDDLDDNGCFDEAQAQAELSKWIDTPEAQLAGFTTQSMQDEIYRRLFEPYNQSLKDLRFVLDSMIAGQAKPF